MLFSRLFKTTKTGKTQVFDIAVEGSGCTVTYGQLDGKVQSRTTQCTGKNIGKKNETSGPQQAVIEATAVWNKKKKSGYSETMGEATAVLLPQKVIAFLGNENSVKFPCYSMPKLNGVNGTYRRASDGTLTLTSRGGEVYPPIPHLEADIGKAMDLTDTNCLNGELYIHGEHLQDIMSAVIKTRELSKKLTFNIFEFPDVDRSFCDKIPLFKSLEKHLDSKHVLPVPITPVDSHSEIDECFKLAVNTNQYEGTVLYNHDAKYLYNYRSTSVLKYKIPLEAEFKVVSFNEDKNGHPVYVCTTEDGQEFKVKRKGTDQERKADLLTAANNVGKWLSVEYECLSRGGTPLKPVGLNFRKCNDNGEPLV